MLGRAPDPGGLAYWTGVLDRGVARDELASLLTTPEVIARRVQHAYQTLLDRPPDPAGSAYWAPQVAAADQRALVIGIGASTEYITLAQTA